MQSRSFLNKKKSKTSL